MAALDTRLEPALISSCFRDLLALRHIDALDPVLTPRALRGHESGLEFADALHAAQRRDGERFVTFDRRLARRAPKAGVLAVGLLQGRGRGRADNSHRRRIRTAAPSAG